MENNNSPVLVIMAAGMGSRFGGLKQITPVDDRGHKIIDYSLYDAYRAGFRKVVFIIKHEIEEDFKAAIGSRMEGYMEVRYVFQELDKLPEGYSVPEGRTKPWGTGHAILCAEDAIDGPFAVINADDYYGTMALKAIYDYLKEEHGPGEHAMVGYKVCNTVTENGYVSRGVCEIENGFLTTVTERVHIEKREKDIAFTENDGQDWTTLPDDTLVSMNMWGFQREILPQFRERFAAFLDENLPKNPLKCEYFLPYVANLQITEGLGSVRVLPTEDVWYGVTYNEDLATVKNAMAEMLEKGIYPEKLWSEPSALYHFSIEGAPVSVERYGFGHVHKTYLVNTTTGRRYILQHINEEAFRDVDGLMENISGLCDFMAKKSDDPRGAMTVVRTLEGDSYYRNSEGSFRVYDFLENTICEQKVTSSEDFYQSALAFGKFQEMLSEYPASTLHEAIPHFHDTPDRYRIFREKIAADVMNRADTCRQEIEFALARESEASILTDMLKNGELPLRVTHNDTKLNNVMLDEETRKAVCVIDLDTTMPGLSCYDFGDSIRFGAATAAEDENDLDKMEMDLEMFEVYARGFLEACSSLTEKEIEVLPLGAKMMTLECGVRFLTDYLDGDKYFHVDRPDHNLDRARTQFKLVRDMEEKWQQMQDIIKKLSK